MTVADYFAQKYNGLSYPSLPCILVHPKSKRTFLPMECLEVRTPQKVIRKLTDQQTATMIRVSAISTGYINVTNSTKEQLHF